MEQHAVDARCQDGSADAEEDDRQAIHHCHGQRESCGDFLPALLQRIMPSLFHASLQLPCKPPRIRIRSHIFYATSCVWSFTE